MEGGVRVSRVVIKARVMFIVRPNRVSFSVTLKA